MLHDDPRLYPGGDRAIEVELGDGMDFTLNFMVHSLAAAIRKSEIRGLEDLIPELASLQLNYDPDMISYEDLGCEVLRLYDGIRGAITGELPSRLITVPVLYFDPETTNCILDYRNKYPDKVSDPDLVANLNGIAGRTDLARIHAGTEYWVAALGFWPGLCSLMPLDPRARLVAPKYNPPRTWTPKGSIGIGGALTCIYPDKTPGGYQLIGQTPVPTYDAAQRLPAFRDSLALFRAGDRVRFRPIGPLEYTEIKTRVDEGQYIHDIVDYQLFSVDRYLRWTKSIADLPANAGVGK